MGLLSIVAIQQVYAISDSKVKDYRIKIHSSSSSVTVKVNDNYAVYIDNKLSDKKPSKTGTNFVFSKDGNKIKMATSDGSLIGVGTEIKLKNKSSDVKYFEVKGIDGVDYAKYPDDVIIRRSSNLNEILVINSTHLETYLKGVLPHEMGSGAPLEALKAQAVTARTLAVKRAGKNASEGYDITNTTSDQVYKGYNSKDFDASSNVYKAIEGTKGKVLLHNGKLLDGIFYSNNGGQTADDGFVWGSGASNPYYVSKADPFDTYLNSYVAGWAKLDYTESYNKEKLRQIILDNSKKYPAYFKTPYCTPSFDGISENFNVEVLNQTNGYVTKVKLSDDKGKSYIFKNYANRWAFGLRSQQFKLTKAANVVSKSSKKLKTSSKVYVKGASKKVISKNASDLVIKSADNNIGKVEVNTYTFKGKGYGHGVGMSQNGAMNRADDGQKYTDILKFYYEGSKIGSNYAN